MVWFVVCLLQKVVPPLSSFRTMNTPKDTACNTSDIELKQIRQGLDLVQAHIIHGASFCIDGSSFSENRLIFALLKFRRIGIAVGDRN